MKAKVLIKLLNKYNKDTTLGEVLEKEGWSEHYRCPKCNGKGTNKIKVKEGRMGYWEAEYKDKKCDVCNGQGYTKKEIIEKTKTEVVGYEEK